jgi:hypothetical protein
MIVIQGSMTTADLQAFYLKRRKAVHWTAGLILGYLVVGFLILPPIVRVVARKQLAQQFDREVTIEKVKLNPLTLSITIRGLLIKDKDGQPFISWDEVYVNFQLSSFLGHPWIFKKVSTTRPFIRVQMNKDYTFNFSDLITKFATNSSPPDAKPSEPLALHIDHLSISNAIASLSDLTPHTPFKRIVGPLNINLDNFRSDPDSKNPYAFSGTTDAGEKLAWSGYFYLNPIRSEGNISVENLSLNKYAPLYQDLVRFEIKDGIADFFSTYHVEVNGSNYVASVTNTTCVLHSFKMAEPNNDTNLVEVPEFSFSGARLDFNTRMAGADLLFVDGAKIFVERDKDKSINLVEAATPNEGAGVPGGIQLLLRSVTNAVAILLSSTNQWKATLAGVVVTNTSVTLADYANARPAQLTLDDIALSVKNISNLPDTNLTASVSLRWNTNGNIKVDTTASFRPVTADIKIGVHGLELGPLDPYLEPMLDVFILGSKVGMDGQVHLRTDTNSTLPEVTFQGDAWLNDFSTVDGVLGEDLLKWSSVRVSGIDANLNPPVVAIKQIAVNDVLARLLIETNRTVNLLTAMHMTNAIGGPAGEKSKTTSAAANTTTNAAPSPAPATNMFTALGLPKISVDTIVISNAAIRFTDRSLKPNVNMTVQQAGGTIAGLSSEELQHADVNLSAKVDGIGPVEIKGTINPFSGQLTNELKINVHDVDLTPLSPYSGVYAGYRIARGKVDLDLAYHLKGRNLKSENLVVLDQFTFGDHVDSPEATKLPVRLGVAILKDRNGKIELDVPIEGNLDDPEFRLRKVIVHTIVNLLTKVATSPFSLLGALFGGRGEEVSYQDFVPGHADLEVAETNKLDALVNGLYERPGLQLEIQGSVDPDADREGLRRVALEKQLRTAKWQSLRKSAQATTTPENITITAEERPDLVRQLFGEAQANGTIDLTKMSANTNTAALAAQIQARAPKDKRGGTLLIENDQTTETATAGPVQPATHPALPPVTDPMELALLTTMTVTDGDLETLATDRAKVVRAYLLATGRVAAERIFLAETQPGGVKTDGARAYLQFR